jgi:hypothetical protein
LVVFFDAFHDDAHLKTVREVDHGTNHLYRLRTNVKLICERAIDFDDVDGKT